jgi:hypothetical protein
MKKNLPLLMMALLLSEGGLAGHFYNIEDESQLKSASQVNYINHTGFSDDLQATLISPRLAIAVRHGVLGGKDQPYHTQISFYGKQYNIIRAIEHPDVKATSHFKSLSSDLTVYVLSENVTHPNGGPVACPLTEIDYTQILPDKDKPLYAHSISQSPKIRLGNFHSKYENTDFSPLYGKTQLSHSIFGNGWYNRSEIRVTTQHNNPDPLLMVTVMGDSGSPLYMPLAGGGYTLIGAMARTHDADDDPFGGGYYTPMSNNIQWLKTIENSLFADNTLSKDTERFSVVKHTQWNLEDHTPCELIPAFRVSNPMGYLALNPDLITAWTHLPFQEALAKADWHMTHLAAQEQRRVYLSQGMGDPVLGTDDLPNPAVYLSLNADLQVVFGKGTLNNALKSAMGHFHTSAKAELRRVSLSNTKHRPEIVTLPDTFFPNTYLHLNPHLLTAPEVTLMGRDTFARWHYKNFGFKEKLPYLLDYSLDDFNKRLMYLGRYPDLRVLMNGKLAANAYYYSVRHYRSLGFLEGRTFEDYNADPQIAPLGEAFAKPKDFDAALYVALNIDIYEHFDKEANYKLSYTDLLTKAEQHYVTVGGPLEGRRYR